MRGILNFTPSWFSVTMGTGILSILLHTSPHRFEGEDVIGTVLYFFNIVLFVAFSAISVARYTCFPGVIGLMLRHPQQSLFLGTIPIGLATIVNATVLIAVPRYGQWAAHLAWGLWWLDVLLTVLCVVGLPLVMFQMHNHQLDTMTAVWLLPVVPAVVAAASGGLVASTLTIGQAKTTLVLAYVLWGMGMTLGVLIMALYFHRLAIHHIPASEIVVSSMLPIGVTGQGAYGLIQIAKVGREVFTSKDIAGVQMAGDIILVVSVIVGIIIWGLGVWWLMHAVSCVLIRMVTGGLKFNLGWWSFTFPIGALTTATILIGELLPSAFFAYFSVVLLVALVILYVAVLTRTVLGAYNMNLLVAPCLSNAIISDDEIPA